MTGLEVSVEAIFELFHELRRSEWGVGLGRVTQPAQRFALDRIERNSAQSSEPVSSAAVSGTLALDQG